MNFQPEPRIGDDERVAAANVLGEHYAVGRLTREEYDERSGQVWSAKTDADLRPLFVDLPSLGIAPQVAQHGVARTATAPRRHGGIPWLPVILLAIGLLFLLPGAWWLICIPLFFLGRGFGRGCGGHSRRS